RELAGQQRDKGVRVGPKPDRRARGGAWPGANHAIPDIDCERLATDVELVGLGQVSERLAAKGNAKAEHKTFRPDVLVGPGRGERRHTHPPEREYRVPELEPRLG